MSNFIYSKKSRYATTRTTGIYDVLGPAARTSGVASSAYCSSVSTMSHHETSFRTSYLLEVLVEKLGELVDLALEVRGASPALGRVEELVWHIRAGLWHLEVESLVVLVLDLGEFAVVDGVENSTSVL